MAKYTKEILKEIVSKSKSVAEVCRHFGIKGSTGAQSHLSKKIKAFELDTSHFTGQGWNKGKVFPKRDAMTYCHRDSTECSHRLKRRLIRDGYKEAECENCGISKWLGEDVVLELDHKDSDHFNNEISNLQILCPNCHAMFTRKRKDAGMVKLAAT